jgi:transcriptional antiterminator RfaH
MLDAPWFVIRTKSHKEQLAYSELVRHGVETFLPLLSVRTQVYGRPARIRTPLFPCYLFARFAAESAFRIKNTPGVRGIVSSDDEPSPIPNNVIEQLRERCANGVLEVPPERFQANDSVKIKSGAFRDWEAIFERYLSGEERVAVLLRVVEATGVRVVLPAWLLRKS